jgi:hypothetical protein
MQNQFSSKQNGKRNVKFLAAHGWICIAIILGVVIPWIIAAYSGNLQIPHNDAWAYSRIAKNFAETGEINLLGWNRSALVGQIFVLGPLAKFISIQQTFISLLAIIGLISIYLILKVHIGSTYSGISVLLITLFPGFGLLATQFMTDIPTFSAMFFSLYLAQKSFIVDSKFLFLFSVLVSVWGVTIREHALASLASLFVVYLFTKPRLKNLNTKFGVIVFLGSIGFIVWFQLWRSSLVGNDPPEFGFRENVPVAVVSGLIKGWFNLSLVLSVIFILMFERSWLSRKYLSLASISLFIGLVFWVYPYLDQFFLPNYLSINGAYSEVLSPSVKLIATEFWIAYVIFALIFGSLSFALFIQSKKNIEPLLTAFGLFTFMGTVFQLATTQSVFDRYFLAFLPGIMLSLFSCCAVRTGDKLKVRIWASTASALFVLILTWALMLNSFAFDSARWNAAKTLTKKGVAANKIDAGLEWVGWHSSDGALYRFIDPPEDTLKYWSFNSIFGTKPCFVLSKSNNLREDGGAITQEWTIKSDYQYSTFLFFGQNKIFIYETKEINCT